MMTETDAVLRQLHHRVNNNFQIITSLMNLHKRMSKQESSDIRFLEEHIQAMAVAYRVVSSHDDLVEVPLGELVSGVIESCRQVANVPGSLLRLSRPVEDTSISLTQGIALALYLATVVPPRLDRAATGKGVLHVELAVDDGKLIIGLEGNWPEPLTLGVLRDRLVSTYVRQLEGTVPEGTGAAAYRIAFPIEVPRPGWAD